MLSMLQSIDGIWFRKHIGKQQDHGMVFNEEDRMEQVIERYSEFEQEKVEGWLRSTVETLYGNGIMFDGIDDSTFSRLAMEAMAKDWAVAFTTAENNLPDDFFTEDEWLSLYGSQNGTYQIAGSSPRLRDSMYDYFEYECTDDHPLMKDEDGQKRLIEKLGGLSYFEELVVLHRVQKWWQKQ